ncbi:MAG: arsenate reductase ArsC [Moraxellaceae bacterium]|nr:arsenate reductase ArsC [Moraxellaceae bacterium]
MKTPLKLLFICTHNRCRSILCEAIANQNHQGVLLAKSAGSSPSGEVHPLTLENLHKQGFSIDNLQSQSWDEHKDFQADIVFTVCDSAKNETCPVWFGESMVIHWGLPDPSKVTDKTQSNQAFIDVIETIKQRMNFLAELVEQNLTQEEFKIQLNRKITENL